MQQFWMIYVEGSPKGPVRIHTSLEMARAEAERLAKVTACKAFVLEAIAECWVELPPTSVKWQLSENALIAIGRP